MKLSRFRKSESLEPLSCPTPQELFDEAAADRNRPNGYSKKLCMSSYTTRTIILSGKDAGKETREEETRNRGGLAGSVERLLSAFRSIVRMAAWTHGSEKKRNAADSVTTPASVSAGIKWVEQGVWNGRQAHLVLLAFDPRPLPKRCFHRLEMNIRVWRAGDALQSIASASHAPLSWEPPAALDLAANAPNIVMFSPRAVVGRATGSTAEPFWDGYFRPDDHFTYFADLRAAQDLALRRTRADDTRCLLHVIAYGDDEEEVSVPGFSVAMVVLSDSKPFDLTLHSVSLQSGVRPGFHYLWTPYKPAKFSSTTRLLPKGQKPIGVDFASAEAARKLEDIIAWCKSYDTKWLGDKNGCVEAPTTKGRTCSSGRCRLCEECSGVQNL